MLRFVPILICGNRRLLLRLILISQNSNFLQPQTDISILANRVDIFNYFNYHNALQTYSMHHTVHEFICYDKDRHKSELNFKSNFILETIERA